jgi:hypothetical protein
LLPLLPLGKRLLKKRISVAAAELWKSTVEADIE